MQTEAQRYAAASKDRDSLSGPETLLRMRDVLARVPVGKSTLWAWVREGKFPKPIKLGPMTTAWRASEVVAWIEQAGRQAA